MFGAVILKILGSRWFWIAVGLLAVVLTVRFGIHEITAYLDHRDQAVEQRVTDRFQREALQQSLAQAQKDQKFWQDQAEQREREAEQYRSDLSALSKRVRDGQTVIREKIASGELHDGEAGDVEIATINVIDGLRTQFLSEEAGK